MITLKHYALSLLVMSAAFVIQETILPNGFDAYSLMALYAYCTVFIFFTGLGGVQVGKHFKDKLGFFYLGSLTLKLILSYAVFPGAFDKSTPLGNLPALHFAAALGIAALLEVWLIFTILKQAFSGTPVYRNLDEEDAKERKKEV